MSEAILPLCLGALAGQDGLTSLGSHLTVHCSSSQLLSCLDWTILVSVPKVPDLPSAEQMPNQMIGQIATLTQQAVRIIFDFSDPFTHKMSRTPVNSDLTGLSHTTVCRAVCNPPCSSHQVSACFTQSPQIRCRRTTLIAMHNWIPQVASVTLQVHKLPTTGKC